MGLPTEARIPGFWAGAVPVIDGTSTDSVCSFSLWYGSEEPVSVVVCYTSTFGGTDGSEGPEYVLRSGIGPTGQDFEELGACLHHCTTG